MIPRVLDGANVVVISPAATGKTEAVLAPVLERVLAAKAEPGMKVLYISPTRALVNDLYRRIQEPVAYVTLTLGRKTGDHPRFGTGGVPDVLLTTPESFDSLITRQPRVFQSLQYVILDEIHLLDNTPRGDQLRILLNRLRMIRSGLAYCALSATIDDLGIGERYFPDPVVCTLPQTRELEYRLVPASAFLSDLEKLARDRGLQKILAFFNARSLVESFSRQLDQGRFAGKVLVHHASLPKVRREDAEQAMNRARQAILLATSTLELGIDIGDVDAVVLYRPPYNISSLLQRVGRGNRRNDRLFALGVYANQWERILFETFFTCAREGRLFERRYHASVAVLPQQIYSYLYQRRRIGTTQKCLEQVLCPPYDHTLVAEVFRHVRAQGTIREVRPGIYQLSDRLETKIAYGKIHSNISDKNFGEYNVVNVANDSSVGRVFYPQDTFILGGAFWQTVSVKEAEKTLYAKYAGNGPEFAKIFEGKGAGNYQYGLAKLLKQKLFPDLSPDEFPFIRESGNSHILHVLGSLYGFIIADALHLEGVEAMDMDGKVLMISNYDQTGLGFPMPRPETIERLIGENIARLEDALGSGAFIYDLPRQCQILDHLRRLDIDGFQDFLSQLRLVEVDHQEFKAVLVHLEK